jgi:hypothetical protein
MNETETRLRDYLQATANTIPDDAESPGLDEPAAHRRHVWPVVLAAAAIAAVLVLTVPLLTRLNNNQPAPAAGSGESLGIPYILSSGSQRAMPDDKSDASDRTLHDGKQTVPMDGSSHGVDGRAGGGWLTAMLGKPGASRIGILQPDGAIRPIGPLNAQLFVLSPDHTQVATTVSDGKGKTRTVVLDIKSGKEIAHITLPHQTTMLWDWNKDGIWLAENWKVKVQPSVWQPTTGQLTTVAVPDFDLGLVAPGGTGTVLVTTRRGDDWCLKAGTLTGGKLSIARESCGTGGRSIYPVLSPDGRTIINTEQKVAIDVATGKVTKLGLTEDLSGFPQPVFEDATHLLVAPLQQPSSAVSPLPTKASEDQGGIRPLVTSSRQVYRCDVTTGACKVALTTPEGQSVSLVNP